MARRWSSVLSYAARNLWHVSVILNVETKTIHKYIQSNIVTRSHFLFALQYPYEKYGVGRPLSGGTQFPFGRDYAQPSRLVREFFIDKRMDKNKNYILDENA